MVVEEIHLPKDLRRSLEEYLRWVKDSGRPRPRAARGWTRCGAVAERTSTRGPLRRREVPETDPDSLRASRPCVG